MEEGEYMDNPTHKNRYLKRAELLEGVYYLEVAIKESFLAASADYYFAIVNRATDEEILLDFHKKDEAGEYIIFNIILDPGSYKQKLLDGRLWDVYLFRRHDSVFLRSRIRSRDPVLNLLSSVDEQRKMIIYPHATKKGNLSFYSNEFMVFAFFDRLWLDKNGTAAFQGYYNFPPALRGTGYTVKSIRLAFTDSIDGSIRYLPLRALERPELSEEFPAVPGVSHAGFTGSFSPGEWLGDAEKKYFKFYLELRYEEAGEEKVLTSGRMKVLNGAKLQLKERIKGKPQPLQVIMKTTSVSHFLSISAGHYHFKKEVTSKLKKEWAGLRRSKWIQDVYKALFRILGHRPANKKLVIFESFLGKQYSDSPRAIYEYMKEHCPDYKLVWSADRMHQSVFEEKGIDCVRRFSVRWLLLMTGAKYWVNNSRFPLWIQKPKHTVYLQTWHGTPLKRLAADMEEVHMPGTNTVKYKKNFLKEAGNWDHLVSPNAYSTDIFRRAFEFDRNMIESGYPRNDYLHQANNEETISGLRQKFRLPEGKKIILYAPTWRDNQFYSKGKYKFTLEMDLEKMHRELGEDYIIILRMHYLVAENLDLTPFAGFAYDFSHLEDIRELYLISDLLITDYSSVFFDYANLRRPMIFFVYDIEEYRDNLRGFYFNFEEKAPGLLTKTTDGLIGEIKRLEEAGFQTGDKFEAFYEQFCYLESGDSSKRVVEAVFT